MREARELRLNGGEEFMIERLDLADQFCTRLMLLELHKFKQFVKSVID